MLLKCLRNGVRVPGVRMVDPECGILGLEWIEGCSVRNILGAGEEGDLDSNATEIEEASEEALDISLAPFGLTICASVYSPEILTVLVNIPHVRRRDESDGY